MQQIVLAGTLTGNAGFKMLLCIASLVGLFFGLYYTVFALLPVTLVTTLGLLGERNGQWRDDLIRFA
jgi:hypothetical protein